MKISFSRKIGLAALSLAVLATAGGAVYARTPVPAPAGKSQPAAGMPAMEQQSWALRCDPQNAAGKGAAAQPRHCEIYQRLFVAKTGQRVAEFAVGFKDAGKSAARGVLVLPLGILLTDDLQMQVDNGKAFKFKVRYCTSSGCYAFLDFNQAVLGVLQAASAINIDAKAFNGTNVVIKLKMDGFSSALKKL